MSVNLPDLVGKVVIDNSQGKAALGEIKTKSAGASDAMGAAGKSAAGLSIGFAAIATAGAVVVGTVSSLISGFAKAGAQLYDLNKQFGIGVVEIQKIQYAAKQSGVTMEALTTSLNLMEKAAAKTPEKFEQLGISFGKLMTSKPDELLGLISDGLKGITSESERAKIAQDIFGEGGSKMLRMLTSDYRGLTKEAESTGLMTKAQAEKAKQLDSAFMKVSDALEKVKINLGEAFAKPGVLLAIKKMADLIGFAARNAERFVNALPGVLAFNVAVEKYQKFMGTDQATKAGGKADGSGTSRQYTLGKGFDAVAKALRDTDKAFDELIAKSGVWEEKASRDAQRTADAHERAAKRVLDAWGDVWDAENEHAGKLRAKLALDETGSIFSPFDTKTFAGGVPYDNGIHGYVPPRSGLWTDKAAEAAKKAAAAQMEAAETAARWAGALQGVALMAGAIGGKLGATVSVLGNIGRSFEGWKDMKGPARFNAIAGGVGQIGGLIGGTAGAGIQGAAGGAMSGFAIGGPVGAVIGGGLGLIGGLFGASKAKKQELADLKSQLSGLSDAAKHFGISLDAAFASKNSSVVKGTIDAVNNAIKESEKRLQGLSTAAAGLNAFTKGGAITDQASSDRAGLYAGAIFGGLVKETGDVISALKAIGPALEEMAAKAQDLGLGVSDVVTNLLGMNGVLKTNEGLGEQISGLNQMMKGLGDAGMITKDLFAAFGADASAVFARLIDGGATGAQALSLMQPTLQQLYEGQKLHGWAVDEATQALLDQAKAEGIVGDEFMSANERMVELLGIIIETLGGKLPESYRKAGDAAEEYGRRATNSIPRGYGYGVAPGEPAPGSTLPPDGPADGGGLASGYSGWVTKPTRFLVGEAGPEYLAVTPVKPTSSTPSTANAPSRNEDSAPIIVNVMLDGEVVTTAVARRVDRNSSGGRALKTAMAR